MMKSSVLSLATLGLLSLTACPGGGGNSTSETTPSTSDTNPTGTGSTSDTATSDATTAGTSPTMTGTGTGTSEGTTTMEPTTSSTTVEPTSSTTVEPTSTGTTGKPTTSDSDSQTDSDTGGADCPPNPNYTCEGPMDCNEVQCGGVSDSFDENGCLRPPCKADEECPAGYLCYHAVDFDDCLPSEIGCSMDNQGCGCFGTDDCGGSHCVEEELYPG